MIGKLGTLVATLTATKTELADQMRVAQQAEDWTTYADLERRYQVVCDLLDICPLLVVHSMYDKQTG